MFLRKKFSEENVAFVPMDELERMQYQTFRSRFMKDVRRGFYYLAADQGIFLRSSFWLVGGAVGIADSFNCLSVARNMHRKNDTIFKVLAGKEDYGEDGRRAFRLYPDRLENEMLK